MSEPSSIRVRGRRVSFFPARDVEAWSRERALDHLRAVASHWAGRDALLRLSDALFGPDEDIARAIAFLSERFECGRLIALRLRDEGLERMAPSPLAAIDWDNLPMLSDLILTPDWGVDAPTRQRLPEAGPDAGAPSAPSPDPSAPASKQRPAVAPSEPDAHTECVVTSPRVVVFDTGGLCFGTDRETFVPTRIDALPGGPNHHFLTGIDAMRRVVEYARAHPEQRACVVGHTDTVGKDASNVELSERRARTVQLFLAGDRDGWAALAVQNQTVADWQTFLQWAHLVMGMNCDPGAVDDDLGEATEGAMRRFRAAYNARYAGVLAVQGPFVADDWKAAFDCYRKNLAEQLGESLASREALLVAAQFAEPPTLACGEEFPAEHAASDGRESARNRRVDVVFHDSNDPPDFGAQPAGEAIYGVEGCRRTYESIAASPFAMLRFCLQDADGAPRAGAVCSLMLDGPLAEATSAADGYVEFRVPAQARTATLLVRGADGRGQERHLTLGGLHGVEEDSGVEGRLRNLGFDTGPDVGNQPDAVAGALSGFQQRCSIDPTGRADDVTRARLAREHGC